MGIDGAAIQSAHLLRGIQSFRFSLHNLIIAMKDQPGSTIETPADSSPLSAERLDQLKVQITAWSRDLGFQQLGVADTRLEQHEEHLQRWLQRGFHGEMAYMKQHGTRRSRPAELVPGTIRVVSVRMDYLSKSATPARQLLGQPGKALISRYALGRDYHKLMRRRLQRLASRIEAEIGPFGYRVLVDSAPVLEKALAEKAGLGWIGKHSNLLHRQAGSWFFLGEIYTDLPLPPDEAGTNHCGECTRCMDFCPTGAIVAPYQVDARRCISYLTIELRGAIPVEFRALIGNRIFGCDDCQMVCPWNRFAKHSGESDYSPRAGLDAAELTELFAWSEEEFLRRTGGSAIRRIGYVGWLRNIAVALGNAPPGKAVIAALRSRQEHPSELVREHVHWALQQLGAD